MADLGLDASQETRITVMQNADRKTRREARRIA